MAKINITNRCMITISLILSLCSFILIGLMYYNSLNNEIQRKQLIELKGIELSTRGTDQVINEILDSIKGNEKIYKAQFNTPD